MEVDYQPEYNPEAIVKYYSCGVQLGRIKNPDIKDLILKAKNHLSAIGWSFFYIFKKPGRRELRYRSPAGKTYFSLRTACQVLIDQKKQDLENHEVDLSSSKINGRYTKCSEELKKKDSSIESANEILIDRKEDHDKNEPDLSSPKINGEYPERSEELKKNDDFSSTDRPKKRIRIQDVESLYFNQQREVIEDDKNESERPKKQLRQVKRIMMESSRKMNDHDLKPKKSIRKGKAPSTRGRNVMSLLIEREIVLPGSRVVYRSKKDGRALAQGRVYDNGIQCDCCGVFFLLSKFEAHAGSTYRRPAANIFLDDGRSLLCCQNQLKQENQAFVIDKPMKSSDRMTGHDEFCSFCNEVGYLLLCDSCTSSFHSSCIGLNGVPESDYWFCPSCCCRICVDQGHVSKFTKEGSHDHGQIKCAQCEHNFHIDCLRKKGVSVSSDCVKWFCSKNCEQIYSGLMRISGKSIPLTVDNLSWSLLKVTNKCTETYSKLNLALDVMHECFEPIKHLWSDGDLVEDVIFSRSSKKSNLKGFFTAVLERDDEVITVFTLRIHGCKAAELPLVATRFRYRRSGMCRILMEEIERRLGELGVERLVLPAVPEMVDTWTQSFGFSVMTEVERFNLVQCKFLDFPGTIKCQKFLKKM